MNKSTTLKVGDAVVMTAEYADFVLIDETRYLAKVIHEVVDVRYANGVTTYRIAPIDPSVLFGADCSRARTVFPDDITRVAHADDGAGVVPVAVEAKRSAWAEIGCEVSADIGDR